MGDLERARRIFDQRVEYPLPKKTGVRDYVAFFVATDRDYGLGAREFFDRFYKDHVRLRVTSIESLISKLHAEVQGGVTQIRELVLVAHATDRGMVVPLVDDTTRFPELTYLTSWSLALLRKGFLEGKFADLVRKRAAVISHFRDDSWITIRACRFAAAPDGMYALYSFFGGRPNLYAPRDYQFFGWTPVAPGMRFENRLEVHGHLVKQHFFPHDLHTPERRDAVVSKLLDPARFSETVDLASRRLGDIPPDEAAEYEAMIDALDKRTITQKLRAAFAAHEHVLGDAARVRVLEKSQRWSIADVVIHPGDRFDVTYEVWEHVAIPSPGAGQNAILSTAATVSSAVTSNAGLPVQLFLYDRENDEFKGRVFDLAAYVEGRGGDPAEKQAFDRYLHNLDNKVFGDGQPGDLLASFAANALDLDHASAAIQVIKRGELWLMSDATQQFDVVHQRPRTTAGGGGHRLAVHVHRDREAQVRHTYDFIKFRGRDPDSPGVELAAYFDRVPMEHLIDVAAYLRATYRPELAYYIQHVQEAITRKREFESWRAADVEKPENKNNPIYLPYQLLRSSESEDYSKLSYSFDFNSVWREVKAGHPELGVAREDLFLEEDFWVKLGNSPRDLDPAQAPPPIEPDSPYTDPAELRPSESRGRERYFVVAKDILDAPAEKAARCKELAAAIAKWKQLIAEGKDTKEIERLLGLEVTPSGKTLFDHILMLYGWYSRVSTGMTLSSLDQIKAGLLEKIVARIPWLGVPGALGTPTILMALIRVSPAITIPMGMWLQFVKEQAKMDSMWERVGLITAVRQWLRALRALTFKHPFPTEIVIDLTPPDGFADEPVYRYFREQSDDSNAWSPIVLSTHLSVGYVAGLKLMRETRAKLFEQADSMIADVMREIGLEECHMKVLVDAGILDRSGLKAIVIRAITTALLDRLPRVTHP